MTRKKLRQQEGERKRFSGTFVRYGTKPASHRLQTESSDENREKRGGQMTRMAGSYSEVSTYWRGVKSTLSQRGLLRQRKQDGSVGIPQARYLVAPDFVAFVLDMHKLGGVSREQWLDADLHAQLRATLQGRRVFVADSAGLAVVIARNPAEKRARLPQRVVLTADLLPDGEYTVTLGLGRNGPVVLDLAGSERAILIGGESGSGKTGTVKSLVAQAVRKCGPEKLTLALVDLKRLDLVAFEGLPHLVAPVATEEADAENLVSWCVDEMERRQVVMGAARVTRWDKLPDGERFPLLLVVVDEVADFGKSPVMADLVRLSRKGRASGISLILATQRPSADVLSSAVKANLPTRIALRVTSGMDSRIILDRSGAQEIKRRGLALCNVGGRWRKVQTAFIPDDQQGEWINVEHIAPILSEVERDLVKFSLENLEGAFKIGALYEAHKGQISKRRLTKLAKTWEGRGWLTSPAHATDARKVTAELLDIAGTHAREGNLSPQRPGSTLDAKKDDRMIGVTRGDRGGSVVIGNELPPFLADRGKQ